jgi:hypothetical protein
MGCPVGVSTSGHDVNFTGRFQVAPGSDLFPASEIDPAERARVGCRDGDFILTRAGSRSRSRVVDWQMAYILAQLQQPTRIVDAVLAASRQFGAEPVVTLDAVLPGLTRLIEDGFVVDARRRGGPPRESLPSGARIGSWDVVTVVHEIDDSDVYQVCRDDGEFGALKLCAPRSKMGRRNILHERELLKRLTHPFVPQLRDHGVFDGRVYLVTEWRHGSDVGLIAREIRSLERDRRRTAQIALSKSIVGAYADLHAAAVVHGDVHEGNLLVDADGELTILDFGIARNLSDPASKPPRGAAGHAWEPEYAASVLANRAAPSATPEGEQFIVAALLFELVTGVGFADFSHESTRALQQVLEDVPRSFEACGVESWPELEIVLRRALAKRPEDRYPSTRAFADALQVVGSGCRSTARRRGRRSVARGAALDQWIAELAAFAGEPSTGVRRAPTASVAYGAAGVAYTLLRLARQEGSASLLAAADVWAEHSYWAMRHDGDNAFGDREMPSVSVGRSSLYFSAPGVHAVRALVGASRGQVTPVRAASRALASCVRTDANDLDLGLGTPGVLLACALVVESTPPWSQAAPRSLFTLGDALASRLWVATDRLPAVPRAVTLRNLGAAHGWAGLLYAMLRWSDASGSPLPNGMSDRFDQLATMAEPIGRGVRFPWNTETDQGPQTDDPRRYMAGWCNGSAGLVHVWLAAWHAFDRESFRDLAEAAAWHAWEDDSDDDTTLCCGLAGRAYALLAWHRHSRDNTWLTRATELVARGIAGLDSTESLDPGLLKGHLSLALLQRELAQPHFARMPLFEPDAWPARHRARRKPGADP